MPLETPTVAVCQVPVDDLDVAANSRRLRDAIEGLPTAVDLAVCPEYALTGFAPDERIEAAALARDDPVLGDLRSLADRRDTALVVGFVEAAGERYYNATAYVSADGDRTVYRKRHLWGQERSVLTPGEASVTVETPVGTTGLLTCYDLNFVAESAALAREGVTALLVVGAWPATHSENWRLLVRARALDGVRWAVGANRTGTRDLPGEEPVAYGGRSLVARPDGGVHRELGRQPQTLVTDLDQDVLETQRDLVGVFAERGDHHDGAGDGS
jgi:predicted amidohydrolase